MSNPRPCEQCGEAKHDYLGVGHLYSPAKRTEPLRAVREIHLPDVRPAMQSYLMAWEEYLERMTRSERGAA